MPLGFDDPGDVSQGSLPSGRAIDDASGIRVASFPLDELTGSLDGRRTFIKPMVPLDDDSTKSKCQNTSHTVGH